jgi:hypothetical protein
VTLVVMLDASPLGLASNPRESSETRAINAWLRAQVRQGTEVVVPEIADYEVRRELLRMRRPASVARLDELKRTLLYVPLSTAVMLRAAEFWAIARQRGRQAASDASLDADMILAAQAVELAAPGDRVVIATTNVRHLSLFVDARPWQEI